MGESGHRQSTVQTFNATQIGHEKTAAFLDNIPMCIDGFQRTAAEEVNLRASAFAGE